MSENRRSPHRETVQALVGVSVIAIGLVTTAVLHFTHDSGRSHRGPEPVPVPATAPGVPGVAVVPVVPREPGPSGLSTDPPCCAPTGPAALGPGPWPG